MISKKRPPDDVANESQGRRHKAARHRPSYLRVRLPTDYTDLLEDLLLLDVNKVEYVQNNSNSNSYLYYICGLILDLEITAITLYRSNSSKDADDADDDCWIKVMSDKEQLLGGVYRCNPHTKPAQINVEKISSGSVTGSRPSTPAASTPTRQVTLPARSPRGQTSPPTAATTNPDLMADCVFTPISQAIILGNQTTFQTQVAGRDGACIVSTKKPNAAKASHLIPRHLLAKVEGVRTGDYTFVDPFDHRVGVLLVPDLDHHVDSFEAGFYVTENEIVFHLFRNDLRPNDSYFTPTTCQYAGQSIALDPDDCTEEVMRWHYKHAILKCWGGKFIQSYLGTFCTAGEGSRLALFFHEESDFDMSPPTSSAFF